MKDILNHKAKFRRLLASSALVLIFLYFFLVSFVEYPEGAQHTVDQINGSVIFCFALILKYFFPDSEQAEENQQALQPSEPKPPQS